MDLKDSVLVERNILLQQDAANWQEAVSIGCKLLEEKGRTKASYYEAILEQTSRLGPFYLLAPGLAMPHARPEDGVLKSGFAVVTLKEPVAFGDPDNDPIDLLITLAAENAEFHNKVGIVQIVTLLDDENAVERLKKAKYVDEIKDIFEALEGDN
ncbi:MAG: PTS sugar transporter subunit IIA [Alphaproteobacteria bacterium]